MTTLVLMAGCSADPGAEAAAVMVAGRLYHVSCAPVAEAALGRVLARLPAQEGRVWVRAVEDLAPEDAVAVSQPHGCGVEGPLWLLAGVDEDAVGRADQVPEWLPVLDPARLAEYERHRRELEAHR